MLGVFLTDDRRVLERTGPYVYVLAFANGIVYQVPGVHQASGLVPGTTYCRSQELPKRRIDVIRVLITVRSVVPVTGRHRRAEQLKTEKYLN